MLAPASPQQKRKQHPPYLAERLLEKLLPRVDRDAILADLAELYANRCDTIGLVRARVWYWKLSWSFPSRIAWENVVQLLWLKSGSQGFRYRGRQRPRNPVTGAGRRGSGPVEFVREVVGDLVYGARSMRRNPTLIAAAVLTLALGIGVNSTVFSIVDVLMLRPLSYEHSERLVQVYGVSQEQAVTHGTLSLPDFVDVRAGSRTLDVAGWAPRNYNLSGGSSPERVSALEVSWNFFQALRVRPAIGRDFSPEEEQAGRHRVAILSDGLWRRLFGADSTILGRTMRLDGVSYSVVGVLPEGFVFAHHNRQVWTPFGVDGQEERANRNVEAFARLVADASLDQARTEVGRIGDRLAEQHRDTNTGWGIDARPLRDSLFPQSARIASIILFVAVSFVVLIACANVANLMLTRIESRGREFVLRGALGAKRSRIVRQLLTEAMAMAAVGGLLGMTVAYVGVRLVLTFIVSEPIPGIGPIGLNMRVVLYTFAVTAVTGVLFGLGPAFKSSRPNLADSLKAGMHSCTNARGDRFRRLMTVSQISLALALLVASTLLIKAFVQLQTMDFGFDREDLFTFRVTLPQSDYSNQEAIAGLQRGFFERLESMPGVASVSGGDALPLVDDNQVTYALPGDVSSSSGSTLRVSLTAVFPGYFQTMRLDLKSGRVFDADDDLNGPAVVVVNEAMAERHWPGERAVGNSIVFAGSTRLVVGVVENFINRFGPHTEPMVFHPALQAPTHSMVVILRTVGSPSNLLDAVKADVASLDPDLAVHSARYMNDVTDAAFAELGAVVSLMLVTAVVAVFLALVGVYGVISYSVSRRTRELGIRMALGANDSAVLGLIVRQGLGLTSIGLLVGLVVAVLLSKGMAGMLFGVSPTDPIVFGTVVTAVLFTCIVATYLPARRATRVDPLEAIRYE